jgi:hypothetical protein
VLKRRISVCALFDERKMRGKDRKFTANKHVTI